MLMFIGGFEMLSHAEFARMHCFTWIFYYNQFHHKYFTFRETLCLCN